jgi:hypothetical protein
MPKFTGNKPGERVCPDCGESKPIHQFFRQYESSQTPSRCRCKTCSYLLHRAKKCEREKQKMASIKAKVFHHYGEKCECCGETTREFLAIDHVHGGGNAHRSELKKNPKYSSHQGIYCWAVDHGFPTTLRILCHNCNTARGLYGYCPHEYPRGVPEVVLKEIRERREAVARERVIDNLRRAGKLSPRRQKIIPKPPKAPIAETPQAEEKRTRMRRNYEQRAFRGICRKSGCDQPAADGKSRCEHHLKCAREQMAERSARQQGKNDPHIF